MSSTGTEQHRAEAADRQVRVAVVTVSDSRNEATDESGALIRRLLAEGGFTEAGYALLPNDEARVRHHVERLLAQGDVDAVLLTGGTGLSRRDRTVEAITPLLQRQVPGFGELFRLLSFQEQIGPAAMLTRAVAGSAGRTFVAVMPGSKAAVELAMTRLIVPELRHAIRELGR